MSARYVFAFVILSLLGSLSVPSQTTRPTTSDESVTSAWEKKQLEDYLGYENCRKCHQMQVDKLVTSQHFKSFETVHRTAKAKSFCRALGIRSIKRDARCIRCHYTPEKSSRGVRARSGISCESCHGPSKNWVRGHNDYGGLTVTKAQETDEHRRFRIHSSIAKGMRHPSNLYLLARSCYECHLVDDAELVNLTEHPPMSADFDMVSWSQGSMRHNFLRTDNKTNAESSPERLQVMYVVDLMARIEAVLKAMASSERDSKHYQFLQNQYLSIAEKLLEISRKIDNQSVDQVIKILKNTSSSDPQRQIESSISIKNLAFEFGKNEASHQLDAIRNMLPTRDQYR